MYLCGIVIELESGERLFIGLRAWRKARDAIARQMINRIAPHVMRASQRALPRDTCRVGAGGVEPTHQP
jgi:hypothetical protein